jgi:hypothetical protein
MLLAGFAVVVFKPALHLMYLLFLKIDFTHARFLIASLLPLTAFVALVLADVEPHDEGRTPIRLVVFGAATAILLVVLIELAVSAIGHRWVSIPVSLGSGPVHLRPASLARIALSLVAWAVLWRVLTGRQASRTTAICCYYALGFWLALHTTYLADRRVNASDTRTPDAPFYRGNFYVAQPSEFRPPSEAQVSAFHRVVEGRDYRAILLCSDRFSSGFCAGHVPEFWQLRTVDGYYGLGVPTRIGQLPWEQGEHELRSIRFTPGRAVSWPLLSLLNVKYAINVDDYVYRNIGRQAAHDSLVTENPVTPVPRAFFAQLVSGVGTPRQAIGRLTTREGITDPSQHSFAEGFSGERTFDVSGVIEVTGGGDRLKILMSPARSERFLVLNELFSPGWTAAIGSTTPARIYATNSFMRGLIVPANAVSVEMTFVPFVRSTAARVVYAISVLLLCLGYRVCQRSSRVRTDETLHAPQLARV